MCSHIGIWCHHHNFGSISTRWLMWTISGQLPRGPRKFLFSTPVKLSRAGNTAKWKNPVVKVYNQMTTKPGGVRGGATGTAPPVVTDSYECQQLQTPINVTGHQLIWMSTIKKSFECQQPQIIKVNSHKSINVNSPKLMLTVTKSLVSTVINSHKC